MRKRLEAAWHLAMAWTFATLIPPLLNPGGYDNVRDWLRDVFGL